MWAFSATLMHGKICSNAVEAAEDNKQPSPRARPPCSPMGLSKRLMKSAKGPGSKGAMLRKAAAMKPSQATTMRLIKEAMSPQHSSTRILLQAATAATILTRQGPIVSKTPAVASKSRAPCAVSARAPQACFMQPSPMRSSA